MSSEFGGSPQESDDEIARRLIDGAGIEDIDWDFSISESPYSQAFVEQFNRMSCIVADDYAKSGLETTLFDERVFIDHLATTQFGELCDITNENADVMRIVVAGSLFTTDSALIDTNTLKSEILTLTNPELGNVRALHENNGHYFGYLPGAFMQGGYPIIRRVYSHDEIVERTRFNTSEYTTGVPTYALYVGELEETLFINAMPILHDSPTLWARVYSRQKVNEHGFGVRPEL